MHNPFSAIDRLLARYTKDRERVMETIHATRGASGFEVLPNGIWKCRFRAYGAEVAEDVRGASADDLVDQLKALDEKSQAARQAAKAEREERRKAHRAAIEHTKAEVKRLGGSRFKVRAADGGAYRWICQHRERKTGVIQDFDEGTADQLVSALQRYLKGARRHA